MAIANGSASAPISGWPRQCSRKRKVEIAEGKYLEKQWPPTTTFDELADISSVMVEK
jgi:hypothetical protein